jgi:mannose-6-phosphate isomerase-like protein (cupin superfamily)
VGLQALVYATDTVMPAVIMTIGEGKIIFVDLTDNYRFRPELKDFLKVSEVQLMGEHKESKIEKQKAELIVN